jgi:hypothetical protein
VLDDSLMKEKDLPDIVDTINHQKLLKETGSSKLKGENLMKVIMGGVYKKQDATTQKKK